MSSNIVKKNPFEEFTEDGNASYSSVGTSSSYRSYQSGPSISSVSHPDPHSDLQNHPQYKQENQSQRNHEGVGSANTSNTTGTTQTCIHSASSSVSSQNSSMASRQPHVSASSSAHSQQQELKRHHESRKNQLKITMAKTSSVSYRKIPLKTSHSGIHGGTGEDIDENLIFLNNGTDQCINTFSSTVKSGHVHAPTSPSRNSNANGYNDDDDDDDDIDNYETCDKRNHKSEHDDSFFQDSMSLSSVDVVDDDDNSNIDENNHKNIKIIKQKFSQHQILLLNLGINMRTTLQNSKKIRNRKWRGKIYKTCFLHSDAVAWALDYLEFHPDTFALLNSYPHDVESFSSAMKISAARTATKRDEGAANLLNLILNEGYITHVTNNQVFEAGTNPRKCYFRFLDFRLDGDWTELLKLKCNAENENDNSGKEDKCQGNGETDLVVSPDALFNLAVTMKKDLTGSGGTDSKIFSWKLSDGTVYDQCFLYTDAVSWALQHETVQQWQGKHRQSSNSSSSNLKKKDTTKYAKSETRATNLLNLFLNEGYVTNVMGEHNGHCLKENVKKVNAVFFRFDQRVLVGNLSSNVLDDEFMQGEKQICDEGKSATEQSTHCEAVPITSTNNATSTLNIFGFPVKKKGSGRPRSVKLPNESYEHSLSHLAQDSTQDEDDSSSRTGKEKEEGGANIFETFKRKISQSPLTKTSSSSQCHGPYDELNQKRTNHNNFPTATPTRVPPHTAFAHDRHLTSKLIDDQSTIPIKSEDVANKYLFSSTEPKTYEEASSDLEKEKKTTILMRQWRNSISRMKIEKEASIDELKGLEQHSATIEFHFDDDDEVDTGEENEKMNGNYGKKKELERKQGQVYYTDIETGKEMQKGRATSSNQCQNNKERCSACFRYIRAYLSGVYSTTKVQKERRRRCICVIVVIFIIAVLIFVASLLIVSTGQKDEPDRTPSGDDQSFDVDDGGRNDRNPPPLRPDPIAPNPSPTPITDTITSDESIFTVEDVKNHILPLIESITKNSVLKDETTPQHKAMKWIIHDITNNPVSAEVARLDSDRVLQRYILGTIFYSTSAFEALDDNDVEDFDSLTSWKTLDGWLTPTSECHWHGVRCGSRNESSHARRGDEISMNMSSHQGRWAEGEGIEVDHSSDRNLATTVTYINLSENGLIGMLPTELGHMIQLEQLRLDGNKLEGDILSRILKLVNLHTLYLDHNYFSGKIPAGIGSLVSLENLDLSYNFFSGIVPNGIGTISKLVDLRLSNNMLTGELPFEFLSLTNLRTFLMDRNSIEGILRKEILSLPKLTVLRLQTNEFIGTLSDNIASLSLEEMHLDDNAFHGPIPSNFDIPKLRELYLERNMFTGKIPEGIGYLQNIEILHLGFNELDNSIPVSIGNSSKLRELHFEYNSLTGTIPVSIRALSRLEILRLNNNFVTGLFPEWLVSLPHLEHLYLNSNKLNGPFPGISSVSEQLSKLTLQDNSIIGSIPDIICGIGVKLLTADCEGPRSLIKCSCCTNCIP